MSFCDGLYYLVLIFVPYTKEDWPGVYLIREFMNETVVVVKELEGRSKIIW